MIDRSLRDEYRAVGALVSATRRGYELERLLVRLFRASHFQATPGAGAAGPRQVDLLATRGTESYLVEAKWRVDKANVNDLDSLRSRLNRTAGHVVGVLVSVNGFTGPVVAEVEANAHQPVLLLSGEDLDRVFNQTEPLVRLLRRKRDALLTHGEVLLDYPKHRSRARRPGSVTVPESEYEFYWPDGHRSRVVDCAARFGQLVFTDDLPDIDWVSEAGVGVSLEITPEVLTERSVLELIDLLGSLGWVSAEARWSIQQSSHAWHGLGVQEFVKHLPRWKERASYPDSHHSEEFAYLDKCDGGFYAISATISAHSSRRAFPVQLSFRLQGIPLDNAPLLQLCSALGVHEAVYYRALTGQALTFSHPNEQLTVRPVAYVVYPSPAFFDDGPSPADSSGETSEHPAEPISAEWVSGIVALNPFYDHDGRASTADPPDDLRQLRDSEYLICRLSDHHPLVYERVVYKLRAVAHARSAGSLLCVVLADWDQVGQASERETPPDIRRGRFFGAEPRSAVSRSPQSRRPRDTGG